MVMCRNIAFLAIVTLSACASHNEAKWSKDGLVSQGREFTVADGNCTAEAYKAIPNSGGTDCFSTSQRVYCSGRPSKKEVALRDKIYNSCMIDKGWEKQPTQ